MHTDQISTNARCATAEVRKDLSGSPSKEVEWREHERSKLKVETEAVQDRIACQMERRWGLGTLGSGSPEGGSNGKVRAEESEIG